MSRLTGNEAKDLMEAYASIYAPQELTEEQVWEEVETWVNSLLEEGYDLSDYTWEEMCEAYLSEAPLNTKGFTFSRGGDRPTLAGAGGNHSLFATRLDSYRQGRTQTGGGPRPTLAGAGGNHSLFATRLDSYRRGLLARPARPKPTAPPVRPAAPAPRQQAPAPRQQAPAPRQQAPTGTAGTTPPARSAGTASPTPEAPSRPSLASQAAELRQMRARSLERQGRTLDAATTSATAKPTVYQANSFDPFDVIKGHLLDEGYADTEESALKIMANMSEDWKQSIIEQNAIVTTGTNTNAAGERIPWTHRVEPSGKRTVEDKFGKRELREPKLKGV